VARCVQYHDARKTFSIFIQNVPHGFNRRNHKKENSIFIQIQAYSCLDTPPPPPTHTHNTQQRNRLPKDALSP
jgi:hypothetical protein